MNQITFIFSSPRKERYKKNLIEAKEFYYGIFNPVFKNKKIEIIEFEEPNSIFGQILSKVDFYLTKLVSLPFYTSKLTTKKNMKTLKKSSHVFLINENVGCSSIFLLLLNKKNRNKTYLFVMGLYSKNIRFKLFKYIHYFLIKAVVKNVDFIFFLGKGEHEKAKSIHPRYKDKFFYFPFSIDYDFWNCEERKSKEKDYILFVGNDGNRDAKLLLNIIKNLEQFQFKVVSKIPELQSVVLSNLHVISGSWGEDVLSDVELRSLYKNARLTILPLKESSQPSGQSVALQSMSVGTPVLISKTSGFWDINEFIENKHIFFQKDDKQASWANSIKDIYNEIERLESVSKNAKELIKNKFDLVNFYRRMEKFL